MLKKYDLYGDPLEWANNIKESNTGKWYRAKDIDPIIEQFVAMGGTLPEETTEPPPPEPFSLADLIKSLPDDDDESFITDEEDTHWIE